MVVTSTLTRLDAEPASACIFTSANGVRAFAAVSSARHLPAFAVGEATAREARGAGFTDIRVADGDATALIALIASQRDDPNVKRGLIHFAGEAIAVDLVGPLSAEGLDVRRVCAYRAAAASQLAPAARAALDTAEVEPLWVALFSARTAAIFLGLADGADLTAQLARVGAACLSDSVAAAASARVWARIAVATRPDSAAMIAAIIGSG
jgi:uroporphyrinogen-III synthase